MDIALRPATIRTLDAFRRRRQRLLLWRAALSLLVVASLALAVIALLDRAWFMPEVVRPWLTLAAYAGGLYAAWRVAFRYLRDARDAKAAARLVETAQPELRERLLSAVELAEPNATDSEEFRARLQDDVAQAVTSMNLRKALPLRSLRPWILALLGTAAVLVGLSFVPGLHLPGFLARAAIPFANLSRPSSVTIAITRPAPASTLAAFASEVPVVVEIIGDAPETVSLETQTNGAKTRRTELKHTVGGSYEGMISVGQADVRYRIRAADAITPWHTLTARPRPRVVEFAKTIVPPAYSGLPPTTITDEHGDVEALDGSTVKLKLKTNQPVSRSEVILNPDQPDRPPGIAATVNADGTLSAELPVKPEHEAWLVALTSKETAFTNEESSAWQMVTIPDLPPVAQILEPMEQLELLPDEAVRISGMAGDDVGLASVELRHAVNGADWQAKELANKPGKEAQVQTVLPLAPLNVKPGDTVILKLSVTDLKGQKVESPPVRVIILEQTVDPQQRQWADQSRRLAQQAAILAERTRDLHKAVQLIQKTVRVQKKAPDAQKADDAIDRAQTELEQVTQRADDLWTQLKQAAQTAPTHLDAAETQLLGERLTSMRRDALANLKQAMSQEHETPEPLKRAASEAVGQADVIASAARVFAAEDSAKVAAQATQQLQRQESLLTDNALQANRDATQRPKWQEQQRAAIAATESARRDIESLKSVVDGGPQRQMDELSKQVNEAANDLRDSLDKKDQNKSPEHLYGAADNLRQRLGRTADAARVIAETAATQSAQARERMQKMGNPALAGLEEAKAALAVAAAEARDPKKRAPKPTKDGLTPVEKAKKELAEASKQLEDQGTLREQSPLTNDQAALDTNRASRAADQVARELEQTAKQQPANPQALAAVQEKATQLGDALRALKADALAQTAMKAIDEAAAQPDPRQTASPTSPADQARAAAESLRQLPDMLRKMKKPDPVLANTAQQASDVSRAAADQLKALAQQASTQPNQPLNLQAAQQVAADAQNRATQVAQQMQAQVQEARSALEQMTPEVSEMMQQVAQDLKKTQQETQAAATDAKAEKPVDAVAEKAQKLQPEAAANAQKMESLQAALRQEANAANLAQADQRQMARTADVALAQMQKKSPQIAQNLKQAAQATQSKPQAQALQSAADAQQQTAQALEALAQNMAKMEDGKQLSEQELAAMQKMEQDLAVQEPLDEAYDRAEQLAEMVKDAGQNPAAVLGELEKELPKNPVMQKALAELSKQTAQSSEQMVAEKSNQPASVGLATELAAHDLARVARHQQRLGQKEAAEQVAQASNKLQQTAAATKTDPTKATGEVGQQAQSSASEAAKAAEQTASQAPTPFTASPFQQVQGAMLAQALDQLDQTLHPMQTQMPGGQQQQAGQQQSSQQQAQQSLQDAQQSQQQQMANSRTQGQVPGSQPGKNQQMAQNQQKPPQSDASQQSTEGGNFQTQLKDGVLGGQMIMVEGDWGHLPSKMAADLSEATRSEAAPEYRAAIESYYKAIATKAKK